MSSSSLNAYIDTYASPVMQWHRRKCSVPLRPHINQTLPQIIQILHFCLVDLLLNYGPNVVTCIEAMAVWRPQIWRDEFTTVGFIPIL